MKKAILNNKFRLSFFCIFFICVSLVILMRTYAGNIDVYFISIFIPIAYGAITLKRFYIKYYKENADLNKHRLIIIISIIVAVACMFIGLFSDGNIRLIFAIIAAATMTFALIFDIQVRKKER